MSPPDHTLPRPVAWLGYGGLLPFVALALLAHLDPHAAPTWSHALTAYGAVILAFVGALHWGIAMSAPTLDPARRGRAFVWSVVPALLAWAALALEHRPFGSLILVLGFGLHLVRDARLAGPAGLRAWYLPLRRRLTLVACTCLLADAWRAALSA